MALYKALLAGHVADHLKAGKRNLAHSLRYRTFDTYLLDATTWATQWEQQQLQTNLTDLHEPGPWLEAPHAKLVTAFARTFDRLAVADAIAASSPVSWQHLNLHGEFDFSDDALKDSLRFDVEALFAFR